VDGGRGTVLVTGGSGFFGEILVTALLEEGFRCVSIDLQRDTLRHPELVSVQGDIRDRRTLEALFEAHRFQAIFHVAAILAHAVSDESLLWTSNVEGTRNVADLAKVYGVPKIVFTSSNCLWGEGLGRPVSEDDPPNPVEVYGRSKLEAERILLSYADDLDVVILRCPTIIEAGRLGLLAILFEFIDEGRKVWVVGREPNVYQFIYAQDLATACLKAYDHDGSDVFNIGSDDVKSLRQVYEYVIAKAGTSARVASLPRGLTLGLMRLAYALKLSPLGPYQYKMIAESFVFDTSKIKRTLDWRPTLTNEEMLYRAYRYYHDHRQEIRGRTNVSAHKQGAKMGVIRLLKWLS
jgi:UDP-glucose 4-epimerase